MKAFVSYKGSTKISSIDDENRKLSLELFAVSTTRMLLGILLTFFIGAGRIYYSVPLDKQSHLIHPLQPQVQQRQEPVPMSVPSTQNQQQAEKDEVFKTFAKLIARLFGGSLVLFGGIGAPIQI